MPVLKQWLTAAVVAGGLLLAAVPVRAELVFFGNGRSMSVKGHAIDGDRLILELRGGGQIICDQTVVSRIEPDEVPDAEPEPSLPGPTVHSRSVAQIVDDVALEQGLTPKMVKLVKAVIQVESGYRDRARSPKGAMGPMQLMPETARRYSVADPYEPRSNIEAGIRVLTSLLNRFELPLALAAYNAGEGAVRRFGGQPPYRETREYVSEVLRLFER
jgi:hypothetical protein